AGTRCEPARSTRYNSSGEPLPSYRHRRSARAPWSVLRSDRAGGRSRGLNDRDDPTARARALSFPLMTLQPVVPTVRPSRHTRGAGLARRARTACLLRTAQRPPSGAGSRRLGPLAASPVAVHAGERPLHSDRRRRPHAVVRSQRTSPRGLLSPPCGGLIPREKPTQIHVLPTPSALQRHPVTPHLPPRPIRRRRHRARGAPLPRLPRACRPALVANAAHRTARRRQLALRQSVGLRRKPPAHQPRSTGRGRTARSGGSGLPTTRSSPPPRR